MGILTTVSYVLFMTWAYSTAPAGDKKVPAVGSQPIELLAALTMAFSVHDVVVQILVKSTSQQYFGKIIKIQFIIGALVYAYIAFGCYAIINRPAAEGSQTIVDYFNKNGWQITYIEIIYSLHILTVIPECMIIMATRWLQIWKWEEAYEVSRNEIAIYVLSYVLCLILKVVDVKISTLIELNGAGSGYCCTVIGPIAGNIKCIYFSSHDPQGYLQVQSIDNDGNSVLTLSKCLCQLKNKSKLK